MAFGETIPGDEAQKFQGFAAEIAALQLARAARSGVTTRVVHVKQHVAAVGELAVTASEAGRFGVFAETGKRWPVYARFSNGSQFHQSDREPDARGFALKLVGVPGKKLIEGLEDQLTQDFLFIDTPALPFKTPDEFMQFFRAAQEGRAKLLPRAIKALGLFPTLAILWGALRAEKVQSFATHAFHTAAPIAFGPSAAKLGLFPLAPGGGRAACRRSRFSARPTSRRGFAAGRSAGRCGLSFSSIRRATSIEDASVIWSGPWVELATLTLPQQDVQSPRGREISDLVHRLSFDPWHATEAHRPLGAIMRARRARLRSERHRSQGGSGAARRAGPLSGRRSVGANPCFDGDPGGPSCPTPRRPLPTRAANRSLRNRTCTLPHGTTTTAEKPRRATRAAVAPSARTSTRQAWICRERNVRRLTPELATNGGARVSHAAPNQRHWCALRPSAIIAGW